MPDIFLSYNREDQATARRFAEAFAAEGLEVWWDTTLRAGEAYDQVTEKALKTAKAVVVLWSKRSVESRWVRAEATLADRQKTLVPVTIEPCERPIMFELTQTAELSHWQGEPADPVWLAFLADLKRFVQSGATAPATPPTAPPPAARQPDKLSVCVLPFANMSNDADQEYFADGISEDIITDLSKVSALSVIARNSAFAFKGRHVDLTQVARQLNVTHILEGSVRKAGNRVRITAQLINGATNDHIWAERYDRNLDDIFELQDEISQAIVAALKLNLFPEEKKAIESGRANSLEVYDKYLRARERFNTGTTPADFLQAADMYREVLALDPDFAEARGGLVLDFVFMTVFAPERAAEFHEQLRGLAKDALARAPDHWTTHLAQLVTLARRKEWIDADAAYSKVRTLAPASSTLDNLNGSFLADLGRVSEAASAHEAARLADPLSIQVAQQLHQFLADLGRQDEAQAEYERARDLRGSHESLEHHALFRALESGDAPAIEAQFRRYLGVATVTIPSIRRVFDVVDQPAAVLALLREDFENPASQDSMRMTFIASYASHFGDTELAMAALRRGVIDMPVSYLALIWGVLLKKARKTQAFKQLVRDLGLYDYWRKSGKWGDFARPVGDDDFEIIG
jgi:adenylate cyclase